MRAAAIVAGLAAAVTLFFLLRPEDEAEDNPAPPPQAATPEPPPRPRPGTRPRTEPRPAFQARLEVIGGRPLGGFRTIRVMRNRRVRLVVRADVTDHVHLHGYDLMRDVAPARNAVFDFRARRPGGFVIELEDRGLHIGRLEVR